MKLFVSYRSANSSEVDPIVHRLRSLEYEVWQDKDSIPVGQDWWQAICEGIQKSDIFIFMVSEESVKSIPCLAELSYAHALNLPIIPFVIKGEWEYNDGGKHDIIFWDDVPDELIDSRAQFLFYEGVSFVEKLQDGIKALLAKNLPRLPASPPPDPRKITDETNNVTVIYDEAYDFAYKGELEHAKKLFRKLVNRNDPILGTISLEWIHLIEEYARLNNMATRRSMRKVAQGQWTIYTTKFPKDFMEGIFDPNQIAQKLKVKPITTKPKVSPPPEEDVINNQQVIETDTNEQTSTRNLMRRYSEEKTNNIQLARDLLNEISERGDIPIFFDVDEENTELRVAEEHYAEEERQRQRMKQIRGEYDDLAHYVVTAKPKSAMKAIKRFMDAYPDYGDPQNLMQQFVSSISLMPEPFEWIEIPAGQVTLGKAWAEKAHSVGQTFKIDCFQLAKYPVTNAQFRKFIEAGGYKTDKWWTKEGLKYRNNKNWTEPRYWTDSQYNDNNQPVVGVSWFEAVAFCLWLNDVTDEDIMLPTEDQWQYAAQGYDGRTYPWGNDWNSDLCNNNVDEKGIGKTAPVTQYEGKGDSPFGIVDMAGNVWEWCLTDYDNKTNVVESNANIRVLRGGSWSDNYLDFFRAADRNWGTPYARDNYYGGFRISRS